MYECRKSKKTVVLRNETGEVLKNQKVKVNLKKHEFLFGVGAFDTLPYANGHRPEIVKTRVEKLLKVYNYGTLPFYWGQFEHKEGQLNTQGLMNSAKFLQENGVTVKGHPLCWHTVCADWLMQYDNKKILDLQLKRIDREVSAFKGVVDMWDVINEVVIMPIFDKYDNAITRICKDLGRVGLVKEVFAAARQANPDATLLINDFNLSTNYEILIDGCLNAGVKIDAIGLQTHQHQGYRGIEFFEEVLKRFEVFGLPLHFTENTLISGDLMPSNIVDLNDFQVDKWPTTEEGEERQKKELGEIYRRVFDHPLCEAITGWDLSDGAWLHAPSGVLREDGTSKPSYEMLDNLINKEWHTEYETMTDDNGNFVLEGFRGEYEVSYDGKVQTVVLGK